MTRINLVRVEELSDQHLIAEYRELPRCLKQKVNIKDAPKNYTLGKGHVKWAAQYPVYMLNRYCELVNEMKYRGFKPNFTSQSLNEQVYEKKMDLVLNGPSYQLTKKDLEISKQRILERYKMKPNWYRWTKRNKPEWME